MNLSALTAVSPIDGRYHAKTEPLADYFSEYALMRYRVKVEILYFIALHSRARLPQLEGLTDADIAGLRRIYTDFSIADAEHIKEIEIYLKDKD